MAQIELACKDVVFHFNKGHITDPSIPMWVLKTKGESYYVNHVDCSVPWSTKETPNNPSTKGSIKVKDCLLVIDEENNASINQLTKHDKIRLNNEAKGITRIVCGWHNKKDLEAAIKQNKIKHGPFKQVGGSCGSQYMVTEILTKKDLSMLILAANNKFRILMPNEVLYRAYDDPNHNPNWYWEDEGDDDEDEV